MNKTVVHLNDEARKEYEAKKKEPKQTACSSCEIKLDIEKNGTIRKPFKKEN